MKKLLIGLILGLFISGCAATYHVRYPQPIIPVRPAITFIDCNSGEGKHVILSDHNIKRYICLSPEEMRKLMWYVLSLEKEITKANATIQEINK